MQKIRNSNFLLHAFIVLSSSTPYKTVLLLYYREFVILMLNKNFDSFENFNSVESFLGYGITSMIVMIVFYYVTQLLLCGEGR